MSGIEDKVVVITGASSSIGEATALLLAERGANVVLGARGLDRLEALASRIAAAGGNAAYARADVKRREDLSNLVGLAMERYGKLDVLINNAGVAPNSLLDELRVEDWEDRRAPTPTKPPRGRNSAGENDETRAPVLRPGLDLFAADLPAPSGPTGSVSATC